MSNSIFVLAMNPAKYDGMPADLKKVLDANTGIEFIHIGKVFDGTTAPGIKLARDANGVFDTSPAEYARWQKRASRSSRNGSARRPRRVNGQALYDDARALLKKHGG